MLLTYLLYLILPTYTLLSMELAFMGSTPTVCIYIIIKRTKDLFSGLIIIDRTKNRVYLCFALLNVSFNTRNIKVEEYKLL